MKNLHKYCSFLFFCMVFLNCVGVCSAARDPNYYYEIGMKYQKSGDYVMSEKCFSSGILKHPYSVALYYSRGKLRQHYLNDCDNAIIDYTRVIKLNPKYNPKAFWRRGLCYYEKGYFLQSIKDYTVCLKLIPRYGRVHFLRAKSYAKIGKLEEAKFDLKLSASYDRSYKASAAKLYKKILYGEVDF